MIQDKWTTMEIKVWEGWEELMQMIFSESSSVEEEWVASEAWEVWEEEAEAGLILSGLADNLKIVFILSFMYIVSLLVYS